MAWFHKTTGLPTNTPNTLHFICHRPKPQNTPKPPQSNFIFINPQNFASNNSAPTVGAVVVCLSEIFFFFITPLLSQSPPDREYVRYSWHGYYTCLVFFTIEEA
ncbi:hypothetical protein LOK49_LG15G02430 [Camellia lanceoleosa]|uniref:Uncharacterized protein n=1 Tax=Camellia lanceoleosa TaxID=1840588 RepID=A0ACC0F5N5_9ERIC|nr:hypothetical protein LOK49_LG15G02430 [Camellia lanceoleosa]